jgi:hypothetical protein
MRGGWNGKPKLEYFIRNIHIPENKDECWRWLGPTDKDGYGKYSDTRAHRQSYKFFRGKIKPGIFICHHCDNPICVNPSHLWAGTPKQNSEDRNAKGRQAKQDRIRKSITVEQALEARTQLLLGRKQRDVAKEYGISPSMAGLILKRKTWHFRDFPGQKMR